MSINQTIVFSNSSRFIRVMIPWAALGSCDFRWSFCSKSFAFSKSTFHLVTSDGDDVCRDLQRLLLWADQTNCLKHVTDWNLLSAAWDKQGDECVSIEVATVDDNIFRLVARTGLPWVLRANIAPDCTLGALSNLGHLHLHLVAPPYCQRTGL